MKYYFLVTVLVLGAVTAYFWNRQETTPLPEQPAPSAALAPALSLSESPGTIPAPASPVSLPALFTKEFNGHNLQLGRVLAETPDYKRYYITYTSGELTISGIMNVPKGSGSFPMIIANHGYIDPGVYTNGRGLRREQDYLARHGYVVLHPDYRNHADSSADTGNDVRFRLGYAEDVINAVYAVKNSDLEFLDKNRIGMLGHSMGGGITTNVLAISPELIRGAVLFAPVSADQKDNFERWLVRRPEVANEILRLFGAPDEKNDFWRNISVSNFLDRIVAPVAIHHGAADDSVPIEWSERLAQQLTTVGKAVELHVYPGEPHEFTAAWSTVMERTTAFFDLHVKNS